MGDPVAVEHLLAAGTAGAMVVLFGAAYALLFALSRVHDRPRLMILAYGAYLLFALAVTVLTVTLNLTGFWAFVAAVMLVGYLLAPHGIWHLCVGTHAAETQNGEAI